ncbi:response regulator transcription factor [Helicobacter cetorum]|uniref:Response regulator n=1 Tax=Helicobacter cetorum (strain ATCC BAA-429 / MIT 00-7128) TaxID=182217 RepID=I0EP56_HELC0|nr:response regulator transcription factor [Helicobacter cetorum]AFI04725.1 response regulator [Helicobacter cetorum MIT 00-7128]
MIEVLMIEDDIELAEILSEYLSQHGIRVTNYDEPYTGISAVNTQHYDLLLLDLTLPNLDGLEVCKRISKQKSIPIIISSARSDVEDKVKALDYGADDYLPKPYDPKELLARIHSLLRRFNKREEIAHHDDLCIFRVDKDSREVYMRDKKLDLTRAEYEILSLLISKKGYVFSRESIAIESESINPESSNKSIDVIIGRLRSKIEKDPKHPEHIISIRGIGYKLEY